jgi:ribosomal protein S18 acetylase RimI-like enzyme
VAINVSEPRRDPDGLNHLASLWGELQSHHLEVSTYPHLVRDAESSWKSRLRWYRRLLADGGSYLTAEDGGQLIGYAMVGIEDGPDDTFEVNGGVAEIVSLIVTRGRRSNGVGQALLEAAERLAHDRGIDTVKVAVMSGNAPAQRFYESHGYSVEESVLYRRLGDR